MASGVHTSEVAGPLGDLYQGTLDCVHCGLCLPACPTYRATGRERSSPRGRIYLMRGVAEGKIPFGELVAEEAYLCLGCRACETACPSGVRYGDLLEKTRAAVEKAGLRRGVAKRIEHVALRHVVPNKRRLRALLSGLRLAQRTGLDRLFAALVPERLSTLMRAAPRVPPANERRPLAERHSAHGERRGQVAFLSGCVMPEIFGAVHRATRDVLVKNGFDVWVPPDQVCCGALHAHAGDRDFAASLASKNIAAFARESSDALIQNSAGCGAAMRDATHWLPGRDDAERYASSVTDILEFLDRVGLRAPSGRIDAKVAYDDPCHLVHGQGVAAAPRKILSAIPGLELVPHHDPGSCCGAAGIYNLTHPEMSAQVLSRKLDALEAVDVDYVASGNPGCLMQLSRGLRERGLRAKAIHPVELLARAYR